MHNRKQSPEQRYNRDERVFDTSNGLAYRCAYSSIALGRSNKQLEHKFRPHHGRSLTIVDDQRNVRHFWGLHLHIIHNQRFRRRLSHHTEAELLNFVQRCQLCACVHATVLEKNRLSIERDGERENASDTNKSYSFKLAAGKLVDN